MKRIGIISISAVFLVVGLVAPAYAQKDDHQNQGKPAQEEQAKPEQQQRPQEQQHQQTQQAKPAEQQHAQQAQQPKPVQEQHAQQPKPAQQHTEQAQQPKPAQQQHAQQAKPTQQEHAQQAKPAQQHVEQAKQNKSAPQQHAQRTEAEQQRQRSIPDLRLSVRTNSRIPDDRFRASFGSSHRFVINRPVIVGGYSRFQYGGFWFGFDQPWPVAWYYTDDVYVDYIDGGYYLCDPYYPGSRVLISVVL
jgi:hypothetical protein